MDYNGVVHLIASTFTLNMWQCCEDCLLSMFLYDLISSVITWPTSPFRIRTSLVVLSCVRPGVTNWIKNWTFKVWSMLTQHAPILHVSEALTVLSSIEAEESPSVISNDWVPLIIRLPCRSTGLQISRSVWALEVMSEVPSSGRFVAASIDIDGPRCLMSCSYMYADLL